MIKANEFNKLVDSIKQKELEKNKRVQADMKLTEDALNDLYIKIEKNKNLGMTVPKYTTIPKILEKEIIDELILNQGYFVDLDKQGHTKIYYNKEDFDNRVKDNNTNRTCLDRDKLLSIEQGNKLKENIEYTEQKSKKDDSEEELTDNKNLAELIASMALHNYLNNNNTNKVRYW